MWQPCFVAGEAVVGGDQRGGARRRHQARQREGGPAELWHHNPSKL